MSTDEGVFPGQVIDGPDAGNLISASVPAWRYVAEITMDLDGPECEPSRTTITGYYRTEGGGWRWIPQWKADELAAEMRRRGIAEGRLIDVLIEGSVQGYLDGIDAADEAESYQPPTREEIEAVVIDPSKLVEKVRHWGPDTKFCVLCRSGEHERVEQPTFPARSWDPDHPGCAPEICGGTKGDPCRWVMRTEGRAHDDDLLDEMRKAGIPSSKLDEVIDAGGADYYLAVTDLEQHRDQRLVPADRLMEGDEIYSPQTDQWYPVVSAETRDGITVVVIEGGFKFRVTSETEYSTKPGEAHRAILASGLDVEGVVKSS